MIEVDNLDDFIKFNSKDVEKIIKSKFRNVLRYNFTYEDLLQSFYLGLVKSNAITRFDKNRGVKFSTYIYSVIQNHIRTIYYTQSLPKHQVVEVPLCKNFESVVGSEDIQSTLENNLIFKVMGEEDKKQPTNKVSFTNLIKFYAKGYRDADIAREFKTSETYVMFRKKKMREVLRNYI